MRHRLAPAAFLVLASSVTLAGAVPALADSPSHSWVYERPRFQNACRPPLKFVAGSCLGGCPAGYQDEGGYCRLRERTGPLR